MFEALFIRNDVHEILIKLECRKRWEQGVRDLLRFKAMMGTLSDLENLKARKEGELVGRWEVYFPKA